MVGRPPEVSKFAVGNTVAQPGLGGTNSVSIAIANKMATMPDKSYDGLQ